MLKGDTGGKSSPLDASKSALACNVWDKQFFMSSRQWKPDYEETQLSSDKTSWINKSENR